AGRLVVTIDLLDESLRGFGHHTTPDMCRPSWARCSSSIATSVLPRALRSPTRNLIGIAFSSRQPSATWRPPAPPAPPPADALALAEDEALAPNPPAPALALADALALNTAGALAPEPLPGRRRAIETSQRFDGAQPPLMLAWSAPAMSAHQFHKCLASIMPR